MAKLPGPSRVDLVVWGAGVVAAAVAAAIASVAGARLGSALTAGVIALTAIVVVGFAILARRDR